MTWGAGNLSDKSISTIAKDFRKEVMGNIKEFTVKEISDEFKEYSFFDYPDQEKAKREIHQAYGHKDKASNYKQVWRWCGKTYTDFEIFYNKLAEQKRFMELTITVEDEDYI